MKIVSLLEHKYSLSNGVTLQFSLPLGNSTSICHAKHVLLYEIKREVNPLQGNTAGSLMKRLNGFDMTTIKVIITVSQKLFNIPQG